MVPMIAPIGARVAPGCRLPQRLATFPALLVRSILGHPRPMHIVPLNPADLVNSPEFFDGLVCHIVGGGTLDELCEQKGLNLALLWQWICADAGRRKAYKAAQSEREEYLKEATLREVRDAMTFSMGNTVDESGAQIPFHKWDKRTQKAVKLIKTNDNGTEIHFVDKLKAADMMSKMLGMQTQRVEHSGALTLEQLVAATPPTPIYEHEQEPASHSDTGDSTTNEH